MTYAVIGFGAVGQALAEAFARKGIEVAVASRRPAEALASRAQAIGPSVTAKSLEEALAADTIILAVPFAQHREVAKAAARWDGKLVIDATNAYGTPLAEFGGLTSSAVVAQAPDADILVNNLGTAFLRDFADITDEDWLGLFQINVMSGVRMTRHYLPRMVGKAWGRVVFVSSESGVNIPKEMIDYGMTKTAQLAISRGLAESVAGSGVTVNAVLPGPTRSEILGNWMAAQAKEQGITQEEAEQAFLKTARPTSLIKRFATTDEVANMIVYLCSEQASATTGAALRVDGGVVRFVA